MSPVRHRAEDLDDLVADITVDCYNDDEVLMGFEAAFDDQVRFPVPGVGSASMSRCSR